MTIERQSDPRGDRVQIGMMGQILPFKDEGSGKRKRAGVWV